MTTTKAHLKRLIDRLPEEELPAASRYLEFLVDVGKDPMIRALAAAPMEDEKISAAEEKAAKRGRAEYLRGEFRSLEDVKRELLP